MSPSPKFDHLQHQQTAINGPRPSPLKLNKESHVINKQKQQQSKNDPVIIYTQSPKVIHTPAGDFMALVQRLTGLSSSQHTTEGGTDDQKDDNLNNWYRYSYSDSGYASPSVLELINGLPEIHYE